MSRHRLPGEPRRGSEARPVLPRRALNRATLARQQLLARAQRPAADVIEHVVGMQAQIPANPYIALWARLDGFDHEELGRLVRDRRAIRATVMRATLHLFTVRDYGWIRPLMQPMLEQRFMTGSPFGRRLAGLDIAEVLCAGRAALEERPMTVAQLGAALQQRWPDREANALAYAMTYLTPLIQIPPRGVWGASKQPTWAPAESFAGVTLVEDASLDDLVLRYLAALGPASVMDIQAWCGLTKLRPVVEGLRPQLKTFSDEQGRELFDLPDAPRPDPGTPAPARFLPEYDNVLLGHADRTRFGDAARALDISNAYWSMLLVDGEVAGTWKLLRDGGTTTLSIRVVGPLSRARRTELEDEAGRLLGLVAAGAAAREVRFTPPA